MLGPNARRRRVGRGDRPLRVAQICGAVDGARWMIEIAERLRGEGYDVVALIGGAGGDTAAQLEAVGIPYQVVPHGLLSTSRWVGLLGSLPRIGRLRHLFDALSMLRSAGRMARVLRRLDADIAHTHVITSILVGRCAAWLARVPIRVSMIPGPYHLESELFRRADLATQWMDHRLLAGSRCVDDIYASLGLDDRRRRCVPYGVDARRFDPARADGGRIRDELKLSSDVPLIGQVAFFYPVLSGPLAPPGVQGRGVKGHDDFVHAARIVLESRPDARFALIGDGWGPAGEQHREDIRRLCRDLGIDHAVSFVGRRTDVADWLAALDVSVQCSLSENYGGTLESLLMEAPTIATRVGAMPEVVIHEQTGLLVEPRDPSGLAAAMLRLIEDREFARALGRRGRERVAGGYTIDHTAARVHAAYRELARARGIDRPPLATPA